MKKKKWLILSGCILISIIMGILGILKYKSYKELEEKKKLYEESVKYTKEKYIAFSSNTMIDDNKDSISTYLNGILAEKEKNELIDTKTYTNSLITVDSFKPDNLENLKKSIDDEINIYSVDLLNYSEKDLLSIIDNPKIEKNTLKTIYNKNDFIKNIDLEKEKRKNYLIFLNELDQYINYFKENKDKFYINKLTYYTTDEEIYNKLDEFNKKYILNLKIEKEKLIETKQNNQVSLRTSDGIPILCYHGILDNPWGQASLFVKVAEFEAQMQYLSENGYTTLFASEIENASSYDKPILITFDDGYKDVYTNAYPILQKYNLKANVYMISGWINGDVYMTSEMTKELSDSITFEIGSHTVSHKALASLSEDQIDYELKESKTSLEALIGKNVDVVAYPTGSYDNRVLKIASKYYKYGLSTNRGKEIPGNLNTYRLNRIYVYRSYNIEQFKNLF